MEKVKNVPEKIVLALETALFGGSVAIFIKSSLVDFLNGSNTVSKSEDVLLLIETLLKKNGLSKDQIAKIVVSAGPGSLMGTRIGMATARGLGNAVSADVIPISILEALAIEGVSENEVLTAVYSDRQSIFYFQKFYLEKGRSVRQISDTTTSKLVKFKEQLENCRSEYLVVLVQDEKEKEMLESLRGEFEKRIVIKILNPSIILGSYYQSIEF